MPEPQTARDRAPVLRVQHPDWSGEQIAREIGCTRERVRQVLSDAKLPTGARLYYRICWYCGKAVGKSPTRNPKLYEVCPNCRAIIYQAVMTCDWCGRVRLRPRKIYNRSDHHFCNHHCSGKWLGGRKREKP